MVTLPRNPHFSVFDKQPDRHGLSRMSTLTIKLDDTAASLVAEAAQVSKQPVEHWLRENICRAAENTLNRASAALQRISPLHPGAMQPALDFNAPLDEFKPYA